MPLFKSKIGLIAATVGSAVGLGTVWRFPAEVQANGGGAFLIIYIACVFILGVPLMLSEFALGRGMRCDAMTAFRKQAPGTQWWLVGAGAVFVAFLIMCFYMVVGGWTIDYLWSSVNGSLFGGLDAMSAQSAPTAVAGAGGTVDIAACDNYFAGFMQDVLKSPLRTPLATVIFVVLNIVVLIGGVQKGIERMSNVVMPMLFVILLIFCGISLSLPGAADGVRFFLEPDFSKITMSVCINALGQALFSLSLAMGILITYASYYSDNTNLPRTSVIVSSMTLVVALMMGLIIFPAVSSFGLADHGLSGTTLAFVTLPEVFVNMTCPVFWSIAFFILLAIAALTSTVSLAEVVICFVQERFHVGRMAAVFIVLVPVAILAGICSLSFGVLEHVRICGDYIFDFLDTITNNYMLPLIALATCLYMGWFAPRGFLVGQLTNQGRYKAGFARVTLFIVRYFAPVAILIILISNIL